MKKGKLIKFEKGWSVLAELRIEMGTKIFTEVPINPSQQLLTSIWAKEGYEVSYTIDDKGFANLEESFRRDLSI